MYKKMLVAIDGSESSLYALRQSLKLAREAECLVTVVSVIPRYEGDLGSMWINNMRDSMRIPCERALSEAEETAKEEKTFIKTVCEEGEIYERIVDLADAENCDLIVMGTKGLSGFEKVLVGSVTARVIGHTQRDVLVVPKKVPVDWKNILLATDGSKYSETAANRVIKIVKFFGANLKIVSVANVPPEIYSHITAPGVVSSLIKKATGYAEVAQKKAEAEGVGTEVFVQEGEAWQVITELARKEDIGLIVIGSHGRTGLRRLLMGSVAEKIIGNSPCPVLVVRA